MASDHVVYLIHFDQPYYHARHYLGTTNDLDHRLWQHEAGTRYGGARLMEVIGQVGITWRLARLWQGGRDVERRLKSWNNGGRLCPICRAESMVGEMFDSLSEEDEDDGEWL